MAIGLAISHKLTEALHLLFTFKLYHPRFKHRVRSITVEPYRKAIVLSCIIMISFIYREFESRLRRKVHAFYYHAGVAEWFNAYGLQP